MAADATAAEAAAGGGGSSNNNNINSINTAAVEYAHGCLVWEHQSSGAQPSVARWCEQQARVRHEVQAGLAPLRISVILLPTHTRTRARTPLTFDDRVQHTFVVQKVPHPLGNNDVRLKIAKVQLLHLAANNFDDACEAVGLHNLARLRDDGGAVHRQHLAGPSLRRKHGKNAGAATHVKDDLVLEKGSGAQNGVPVAQRARLVLEHLFVDAVVPVRIHVVVLCGGLRKVDDSGGGGGGGGCGGRR